MSRLNVSLFYIALFFSLVINLTGCTPYDYSNSNKAQVHASSAAIVVNDAAIVSQIEAKIKTNPILYSSKVAISSNFGIVHVSGLVEYVHQAEKIVTIAQSVMGVKDVDVEGLQIGKDRVTARKLSADAKITAKVNGALLRENLLNISLDEGIEIVTEKKVVYLTGSIGDPMHIQNIVTTTRLVPGVIKVINDIKIE